MRTTFTCRRFSADPVSDAVFYEAIELARFAPQGGNRQPVRFLIVRDRALRSRLGELYREVWDGFWATAQEGSGSPDEQGTTLSPVDEFALGFGEHPTIVCVCADLGLVRPTDGGLDRLSVVGGASIYPMVQNFCLALRDRGVATALTTLLVEREAEVKELLEIPDDWATACHVVAGYPAAGFPRRLTRRPVEELAFLDRFGSSLGGSAGGG